MLSASRFKIRLDYFLICAMLLVFVIYFAFVFRYNCNLSWTDLRDILRKDDVHNLKEFYREIGRLDLPSRLRHKYEHRAKHFHSTIRETYRTASSEEWVTETLEQAWERRRLAGKFKPGITAKDLAKELWLEVEYPSLWENLIHIFNESTVVIVYLDTDERIIGWKL